MVEGAGFCLPFWFGREQSARISYLKASILKVFTLEVSILKVFTLRYPFRAFI